MRVLIAVIGALTLATPLAAQSATATAVAVAGPAVAGKYSVETPLEIIIADPAGKAVLDRDLPGLTTHAMFDQFKSMSLKQLQPMSSGKITDDSLVKLSADLAAVK